MTDFTVSRPPTGLPDVFGNRPDLMRQQANAKKDDLSIVTICYDSAARRGRTS